LPPLIRRYLTRRHWRGHSCQVRRRLSTPQDAWRHIDGLAWQIANVKLRTSNFELRTEVVASATSISLERPRSEQEKMAAKRRPPFEVRSLKFEVR
jgi:hypothetical protein